MEQPMLVAMAYTNYAINMLKLYAYYMPRMAFCLAMMGVCAARYHFWATLARLLGASES